MSDSFVQVQPDSSGKKIDTQILDNGNYRQSVAIGDPTANGNLVSVTPDGYLNVASFPTQIFLDTFDINLDTANRWNSPVVTGNSTVLVSNGVLTLQTDTVSNTYSKLQSQPYFVMNDPSYIYVNYAIDIEYPVLTVGYRFWGLGLTPTTPTVASPMYNGYGFEIGADGKLLAVSYANGTRNIIQDLSATGNNSQPTDSLYHKYIMLISSETSYWCIDNLTNVVASFSVPQYSSVINTLPILIMAIANTGAVSINCDRTNIGDSGRNNFQISDGTYAWRQANVNTFGALGVKEVESLSASIGNVTANAGTWTSSKQYYVGNTVTSLGALYTCTASGISGNTVISTNTFAPTPIIDNSVTWAMTYVIPPTDTSNYKSISVQLNSGINNGGTGVRVIQSNDNINWFITAGFSAHVDPAPIDELTTPGLMIVPVYGRYYAVVPFQYTNGSVLSVYSYLRDIDSNGMGANLMARAMDQTDPQPLSVQDVKTLRDPRGAAIQSDAPQTLYYGLNSGTNTVIIDTQGYASTTISSFGTFVATATFYTSNDQSTWSITLGYSVTTGTALSTITTTGSMVVIPNYGRYLKIQLTVFTSGLLQLAVNLRQNGGQVFPTTVTSNTQQVGGTTVVTAGVAGIQAIGGNIANGVAATANPVYVAGSDSAFITRRLLTDTTGRLIASVFDQAGVSRVATMLSPGTTMNNVPPQPTMDQTNYEGQALADLFAQILLELRIMNQQIYELPKMLNTGIVNVADEPQLLRNDPTLFQQ